MQTFIHNFNSYIIFQVRKTGRPVRLSLDRDVDMALSGQRHPYLGKGMGCMEAL